MKTIDLINVEKLLTEKFPKHTFMIKNETIHRVLMMYRVLFIDDKKTDFIFSEEAFFLDNFIDGLISVVEIILYE